MHAYPLRAFQWYQKSARKTKGCCDLGDLDVTKNKESKQTTFLNRWMVMFKWCLTMNKAHE